MIMWQTIAVISIVAVALVFAARRTFRAVNGNAGCACTGCDKKELGCGK
jgi:hypothetical protein